MKKSIKPPSLTRMATHQDHSLPTTLKVCISITSALVTNSSRSAELEQVAQTLGSCSSILPSLSRSFHAGSHQLGIPTSCKGSTYQRGRSFVPDHYSHSLRRCSTAVLVTNQQRLWKTSYLCLRQCARCRSSCSRSSSSDMGWHTRRSSLRWHWHFCGYGYRRRGSC